MEQGRVLLVIDCHGCTLSLLKRYVTNAAPVSSPPLYPVDSLFTFLFSLSAVDLETFIFVYLLL